MPEQRDNEFHRTEQDRARFCNLHKFSNDDWEKADIEWEELVSIAEDHASQVSSLSASASMYAAIIQNISGVHSVRWRIKDPSHLASKIVRKRMEGKNAYKEINSSNYFDIVTDLVGIRALHLFKDDFQSIHTNLASFLDDKEKPVANIREGDHESFSTLCKGLDIEVKEHAAGYRSIHYVKTVKPLNRELHMEIQVRTVFEEGWSEVDHRVRYPNFSTDPLVSYASLILNRLSGMADEMSSYAKKLTEALSEKEALIQAYQQENDSALQRVNDLVLALESAKEDSATHKESVNKLKSELLNLKATNSRERQRIKELKLISPGEVLGLGIRPDFPGQNTAVSSSLLESLRRFSEQPGDKSTE